MNDDLENLEGSLDGLRSAIETNSGLHDETIIAMRHLISAIKVLSQEVLELREQIKSQDL